MPALFFCVILNAITTVPLMLRPTVWMLLAVLLLVACESGEQQRLQLAELERQNRADSLMLNDSLARDLADYFDRHGTPNEQMRAHYILGRTYADRGESPAALDAYNDAADRADTTAQDCDYYTLCRVYSQMATVFFDQNLIGDNLRCLDLSIFYAYKANDTIAALNSYGQKLSSYEKLELNDSIISVCENTYNSFCELGHRNIASRYLAYGLMAYTATGAYDNAKRCMDIYENESGYFYQHNIELGRESYYSLKGDYYLAIGHCDSAEFFYRKELSEGADFNNQTLAAQGLSKLYNYLNISDSVAKYALYAYAMNDSNYHQMTTTEIDRIQSMYDYSRHQRTAQLEKERADHLRNSLLVAISFSVIITLLFIIVYIRHKTARQLLENQYRTEMEKLAQSQADLLALQSEQFVSQKLLNQKELEIKDLQERAERFRHKIKSLQRHALNERLQNAPVTLRFQNYLKENPYQIPTWEDWKEMKILVNHEIPSFYDILNAEGKLNDFEYDVCVLLRLRFSPANIAKLKKCTPSYITQIRKSIYQKVFRKEGRAEDLDDYIMTLS